MGEQRLTEMGEGRERCRREREREMGEQRVTEMGEGRERSGRAGEEMRGERERAQREKNEREWLLGFNVPSTC